MELYWNSHLFAGHHALIGVEERRGVVAPPINGQAWAAHLHPGAHLAVEGRKQGRVEVVVVEAHHASPGAFDGALGKKHFFLFTEEIFYFFLVIEPKQEKQQRSDYPFFQCNF